MSRRWRDFFYADFFCYQISNNADIFRCTYFQE